MEIFCDAQINDQIYDMFLCSQVIWIIKWNPWNGPDQ